MENHSYRLTVSNALSFTNMLDGLTKIGTELLNTRKQNNSILNAWGIDHDTDLKLNGTIYKSPLPFYLKNEFEVLSTTRLDTDKIKAVKIKWTKNSAKDLSEEKTK